MNKEISLYGEKVQGHWAGFPLLDGDTAEKGDRDAGSKVESMFFEVQIIGNF